MAAKREHRAPDACEERFGAETCRKLRDALHKACKSCKGCACNDVEHENGHVPTGGNGYTGNGTVGTNGN